MKSLRIYLVVTAVLLIVYIVAQVNRPKAIDWTETLANKDKIPYGTYVLYNRLTDIFPNAHITPFGQPVYNVIAEDSVKQSSYIIICPQIEITKPDYNQLINYIKKGNDVFIAAKHFGALLNKNLKLETQFDSKLLRSESTVPVRFVNPGLDAKKMYSMDKFAGNFYFNKFDTLHAVVLGENINHEANFIKYTFGKGSLYLAANPKLFSNYSVLKPQGAQYAAIALSHVKNTANIIWDEYYTQGDTGAGSPMRLFLSNPFLQGAYYITIFSLLAFVLYEMKRRQRIIPVIKPLNNLTLDFVTTVGQVYYEKRNNANIAQKKILYLLTYLRDEHHIKTAKLDEEFVEKITSKLGLDTEFAHYLVNKINYISVQERINDNELIALNKLIEQFYIEAR